MSALQLTTAQAQTWFNGFPDDVRLASLSPFFAQADVNRASGLECVHIGFEAGCQRWLHSFHLRRLPQSRAFGAISPYGYGGPIANTSDADFLRQAWQAHTAWCTKNSVLAEFCRFHPVARNQRFFLGLTAFNRDTVIVDLDTQNLAQSFNSLAKRKLKKCPNVTVRWSREANDWQKFALFYRRAMLALKSRDEYLFSDSHFQAIGRLASANLCICSLGEQWLSAGVYLFERTSAEYYLGASCAEGFAAGTPYLLQYAAALEGLKTASLALYLGGGTGPNQDDPLLFYKRCFSKKSVPFFTGTAIHDDRAYWAVAESLGFSRSRPPSRVLLD